MKLDTFGLFAFWFSFEITWRLMEQAFKAKKRWPLLEREERTEGVTAGVLTAFFLLSTVVLLCLSLFGWEFPKWVFWALASPYVFWTWVGFSALSERKWYSGLRITVWGAVPLIWLFMKAVA